MVLSSTASDIATALSTAPRPSTEPFQDSRVQAACAMIREPRFHLLTLDFFDTILWRPLRTPQHLFDLVAGELQERGLLRRSVTPAAFRRARIASEGRARRLAWERFNKTDLPLREIYEEFPRSLLNRRDPDGMAEAEVDTDATVLTVAQDLVKLCRAACACGKPIVVVSDTYYSAVDLERLLVQAGWPADLMPARIFASCEKGKLKSSGLFPEVLKDLDIEASKVLHVGDSPTSDLKSAQAAGMSCVCIEKGSPALRSTTELERLYIPVPAPAVVTRESLSDFGIPSARARAESMPWPADHRFHRQYGATILGPLFAAFGEWVVQRCVEDGLRSALCLLREGVFLERLLRATTRDLRISCLAASRLAMAKCRLVKGTDQELSRILAAYPYPITVRQFFTDLGLTPSDAGPFTELLDHYVICQASDLRSPLKRYVSALPHLRDKIVATAALRRKSFLEHLQSHLETGAQEACLVDLGYNGSIQTDIQAILEAEEVQLKTLGLYFGTFRTSAAIDQGDLRFEGFLVDGSDPASLSAALLRGHPILEQAVMPDLATVVDFDASGPVFGETLIDREQVAAQQAVQDGILDFVEAWRQVRDEAGLKVDVRDPAFQSLLGGIAMRAMIDPTALELEHVGSWRHEVNFGTRLTRPLSGDAKFVQFLEYLPVENVFGLPIAWPFGALKQYAPRTHAAVVQRTLLGGAAMLAKATQCRTNVKCSLSPDGHFRAWQDCKAVDNGQRKLSATFVWKVDKPEPVKGLRLTFENCGAALRLEGLRLFASENSSAGAELALLELSNQVLVLDRPEQWTLVRGKPGPGKVVLAEKNEIQIWVKSLPIEPSRAVRVEVYFECVEPAAAVQS